MILVSLVYGIFFCCRICLLIQTADLLAWRERNVAVSAVGFLFKGGCDVFVSDSSLPLCAFPSLFSVRI